MAVAARPPVPSPLQWSDNIADALVLPQTLPGPESDPSQRCAWRLQGHGASPATQAACLPWMMTATSSAGVTPGPQPWTLQMPGSAGQGWGGWGFLWVWPVREQGLRRASWSVHPYREVGGGGHPVKAIPERLEAVDVGGEVPRPGLGEDSPGRPQDPVGLEGLLQVLGQAAAVVDDGPELLHLWAPGPCCRRGPLRGWADPPPHPCPGLPGRRMPPWAASLEGSPAGPCFS